MPLRIEVDRARLIDFCRTWKVTELSFFGSVFREDFRPESDVDVLVAFAAEAEWSLLDLASMQLELQGIIGRKVNLVERQAVEKSQNYIRRRHVLESLDAVYVAG